MKILVTGGAGFIGSHIADYFADNNDVIVLDNLSTGKKENIPDSVHFVEGDILDLKLLNKITHDVDYIFHEAAQVSVPQSMQDPTKTVEINVIGTLNVLKAGIKNNVEKIILASSAAVYGDNQAVTQTEDMSLNPKSPYAVSKLGCEYLSKIFYEEFELRTTSLRYFNVYGPRQDPNSQYAAVIPIFIQNALRNEDLVIYGDGTQTRDFIFVSDVVYANKLMMTNGDGKIFNTASGSAITIRELAEMIIELTNSSSDIVYRKERTGDIKRSLADISLIRSIGFKPKVGLKDGLNIMIKWFKETTHYSK